MKFEIWLKSSQRTLTKEPVLAWVLINAGISIF